MARPEGDNRPRPTEQDPDRDTSAAGGTTDGGRSPVRAKRQRHRLQPGRVIAVGARAAKRFWWQILAVAIPVSLVSSGLEIVIDHYVDPSDAILSLGAAVGSTGVSLLGTVLLSGVVCRLVGAAEHGQPPLTLPQVMRSLPWWRLLVADVLVAAAVVAGLLLLVVPGLAVLTLLAVVGPVIEIEHRRVFAALRRSAQLTRHHLASVLLLATVPLLVVAELEAIAPNPNRGGEIAEFLLVRGVAEGIVEACLAVILCELCYQLIDADAARRRRIGGNEPSSSPSPMRSDDRPGGLRRQPRQQRAVLQVRQHVPGEQVALAGVRIARQDERLHAEVGIGPQLGEHLIGVTDDGCPCAGARSADPGPEVRFHEALVVRQVAQLALPELPDGCHVQ
jgi:hypothetical protein